ncbi:hypothetical protein ACSBR1_038859 [Camellia fascicularis]
MIQWPNLFLPLWILKTTKEKRMQRLVHMSADMTRQIGIMLENAQNGICGEVWSFYLNDGVYHGYLLLISEEWKEDADLGQVWHLINNLSFYLFIFFPSHHLFTFLYIFS